MRLSTTSASGTGSAPSPRLATMTPKVPWLINPAHAVPRRVASRRSAADGVPDGMKVDREGRVYCTGPDGCWVFDPAGALIGVIHLLEYPANCAWGGSDNQTMFFTANTSIYSLRMKTPGTLIPRA